jgi:hypothetical protein
MEAWMQIEEERLAEAAALGGDTLTLVLLQHAGFIRYDLHPRGDDQVELSVWLSGQGEAVYGLPALIERIADSAGLSPMEGPADGGLYFCGAPGSAQAPLDEDISAEEMFHRAIDPLMKIAHAGAIELRAEKCNSAGGTSVSIEVTLTQKDKADREATRVEVERLVAGIAHDLGMQLEARGQSLYTHLMFLLPAPIATLEVEGDDGLDGIDWS